MARLSRSARRHGSGLEAEGHIAQRRSPREQPVFLKVVAERWHAARRHHAAVDRDGSGVGALKPGDDVEQGALSASRWPEQRDDLAGCECERDVLQRMHMSAGGIAEIT